MTDGFEAFQAADGGPITTNIDGAEVVDPKERSVTRPRHPRLNHDDQTMTLAVTFSWQAPWAMSSCEAAELVGDLFRLVTEHYADDRWEHLAGIESVSTWDADEERTIGASQAPHRFTRTQA